MMFGFLPRKTPSLPGLVTDDLDNVSLMLRYQAQA